jgi:hypothetical protein
MTLAYRYYSEEIRMTPSWAIVLSGAIVSSALGFLFAILGLIISQRYQQALDRKSLASVLLTEALDILDTLQLYQEMVEKLEVGAPLPTVAIAREDMQVYLSNTSKLSLLIPTGMMYIVKFYSRVRRVAAGAPTRDYIGVGDKSSLAKKDALVKEIADAISMGHAVVNHLEREAPPERLSKMSGASLDLAMFRDREKKRHGS